MKSVVLIFLILATLYSCYDQSSMDITLKNGKPFTKVTLNFPDTIIYIPLDSLGEASVRITLPEKHWGYGKLFYGYAQVALFCCEDFSAEVSLKTLNPEVIFKGKGALFNEQVNELKAVDKEVYKLPEEDFLAEIDKRYEKRNEKLNKMHFPEKFKQIELYRLKLLDAYAVCSYPSLHANLLNQAEKKPSTNYYKYLDNYIIDDSIVLQNQQSKGLLLSAIEDIAMMKSEKQVKTARDELGIKVDYVLKSFTNSSLKSYLIQSLITTYTSRYGVGDLGELRETFNRFVLDSIAKQDLNNLYIQTQRLQSGKPAFDFAFNDIDGKTVTLRSLRGKYVYIDVWATWCGPCCKEIPYLEKLVEKYKNKDICFVSISIDKNQKAWRDMVIKRSMKGIQLNVGDNKEFEKNYMITLIPRFILLDKQGNIINAKMSRPSDPKTSIMLEQLLKV